MIVQNLTLRFESQEEVLRYTHAARAVFLQGSPEQPPCTDQDWSLLQEVAKSLAGPNHANVFYGIVIPAIFLAALEYTQVLQK